MHIAVRELNKKIMNNQQRWRSKFLLRENYPGKSTFSKRNPVDLVLKHEKLKTSCQERERERERERESRAGPKVEFLGSGPPPPHSPSYCFYCVIVLMFKISIFMERPKLNAGNVKHRLH